MSEKVAATFLQGGALFPDMTEEAETYLFARNFHHQLKAQLLHREAVLQVIRETTLDPTIEVGLLNSAIPPVRCKSVPVLPQNSRRRSTLRARGSNRGSWPTCVRTFATWA